MPAPATQDLTVSLLISVNRLLAEADRVRTLRDRLLAAVSDQQTAEPPHASPRKEVAGASR